MCCFWESQFTVYGNHTLVSLFRSFYANELHITEHLTSFSKEPGFVKACNQDLIQVRISAEGSIF
uniref:Uncharacterized protein n=1 Tax=Arundo donax TaxID=35708 RepID=A0A0A9DXZ9_ARUDO